MEHDLIGNDELRGAANQILEQMRKDGPNTPLGSASDDPSDLANKISNLQAGLANEGYDIAISGDFDGATKAAFSDWLTAKGADQIDPSLKVVAGAFNFEVEPSILPRSSNNALAPNGLVREGSTRGATR